MDEQVRPVDPEGCIKKVKGGTGKEPVTKEEGGEVTGQKETRGRYSHNA